MTRRNFPRAICALLVGECGNASGKTTGPPRVRLALVTDIGELGDTSLHDSAYAKNGVRSRTMVKDETIVSVVRAGDGNDRKPCVTQRTIGYGRRMQTPMEPPYRPPQPGPDLPIDPPIGPVSDPPVLPPDDPGTPTPIPSPITL